MPRAAAWRVAVEAETVLPVLELGRLLRAEEMSVLRRSSAGLAQAVVGRR